MRPSRYRVITSEQIYILELKHISDMNTYENILLVNSIKNTGKFKVRADNWR